MIWQKVLMNIKSRLSKPALKHWIFFSPKFNQNRTEVPKSCYCAIFERRCSKCDQFFFKLNCQQIILLSKSRSQLLLAKSARFRKNAVINCNPPTSGLQSHSVLKFILVWKKNQPKGQFISKGPKKPTIFLKDFYPLKRGPNDDTKKSF